MVKLLPESSLNIIISGILTLSGVILGVWLDRHFNEKAVKESLFKALFEEIELNHFVAKQTQETYDGPQWTIFELPPFYNLAYQNIRTSGELALLSRDTLTLLQNTYEMIYAHNRQEMEIVNAPSPGFIRDSGLKERIEKIEASLGKLEESIPKELRFLKSKDP